MQTLPSINDVKVNRGGAGNALKFFSCTLVGDVNRDGKVTVADLTALINIQLINQQITNKKADVNGDGNVNTDDIHVLRDILLEKTK